MERKQLESFLNETLAPGEFSDYGPNGLQIEGNESIKKVAFAVSATAHSVAEAVKAKADTLIVHHGLFWKFHGTRPIIGPHYKRIAPLIKNNMNLYGYHLPLDAHMELGNAATLASKLELTDLQPFGDYKGCPVGVQGKFKAPLKAEELHQKLEVILNHQVLHAHPEGKDSIHSLGIITGGANGEWVQALNLGLDAYLTGEMSEHDWHESQESGIHMFAGGHHATEQFGIQALMDAIQRKFSVETIYIDSENPA